MTEIPVVETARLRLRAHRADDYPSSSAMWADPQVTRFIGGRPSSAQQTWSRLLGYVGHWQLQHYGYWAIEEKSTGRFIGDVGFSDFKRDIIEPMRNVPELGFALISTVHGKGYATEAVRAATEWGDGHLPSKRTVCLVDEKNAASLHIVRNAGYREFDRITFNDTPVVLLERVTGRD